MGEGSNEKGSLPDDMHVVQGDISREFDFYLDPQMPFPFEKTGPVEDTISIQIDHNNPVFFLKIGSQQNSDLRERLNNFLKANLDVFAWSHADMVGIDLKVMCHHLNIDPAKKRVR